MTDSNKMPKRRTNKKPGKTLRQEDKQTDSGKGNQKPHLLLGQPEGGNWNDPVAVDKIAEAFGQAMCKHIREVKARKAAEKAKANGA